MFCTAQKAEALSCFKESGTYIQFVVSSLLQYSHRGGDFKSHDFADYCLAEGTPQEIFTAPYKFVRSRTNGVSERDNRTFVEASCSLNVASITAVCLCNFNLGGRKPLTLLPCIYVLNRTGTRLMLLVLLFNCGMVEAFACACEGIHPVVLPLICSCS